MNTKAQTVGPAMIAAIVGGIFLLIGGFQFANSFPTGEVSGTGIGFMLVGAGALALAAKMK